MAFRILFTSQILSIINMFYLTSVHYSLKYGTSAGKSLCNISTTFNCDVVNTSVYSSFLGIPVSIWGAFVNIVLLMVALAAALSNEEEKRERYLRLTFFGALFGVLSSVVMGFISFAFLDSYCLFCIFGYGLSLVTLICSWKLNETSPTTEIGKDFSFLVRPEGRWLGIMVVLIPAVSWLANDIVLDSYQSLPEAVIQQNMQNWKSAPEVTFDTDNSMTIGSENPKMTIVEFADFQCIHCKMAAPVLHNFALSRPGVKLVFMSFPLDGACNPAIGRSRDGRSCKLAYSNICAYRNGGGWQMHDFIFEAFQDAKPEAVRKKAEEFGVNMEAYNECLESSETKDFIMKQAEQGQKAKVMGTPAVFVNGRMLEHGQSWQMLETIYNSL